MPPPSRGWLRFRDWDGVELRLRGPRGSQLLLVRGARLSIEPDGALLRATELLPEGTVAQPLPPHLGGGYIFLSSRASRTRLWVSETFTGRLRALASVSPEVLRVVPGLDRLYLVAPPAYHALRALDPASGELTGLGLLPRSASFGQLAFASAWFGVAEVGVQGALATWDAGQTWSPLPTREPIRDLVPSARGGILVAAGAQRFRIGPRGGWSQWPLHGADAAFDLPQGAWEADPHEQPSSAERAGSASPLLHRAVMSGVSVDSRSAWMLTRQELVQVRLSDGRPLARRRAEGGESCRGFVHGGVPAFLCQGPGEPTRVLRWLPGGALQPLAAWPQETAAELLPGDALRVWAACPPAIGARRSPELRLAEAAKPRSYRSVSACLTGAHGVWHEVRLVLPPRESLQVAPLALRRPGALAVVVRDRRAARLSRYDWSSLAPQAPWRATRVQAGASIRLAPSWQRTASDWGGGVVGAWAARAQGVTAVEISPEGELTTRPLATAATWLHGRRVLTALGDSQLRWSRDGGRSFSTLPTPPALSAALGPARTREERGCTEVGCVYDDWLIVLLPGQALPAAERLAAAPPQRGSEAIAGRLDLSCRCAPAVSPTALPAPPSPWAPTLSSRVRQLGSRGTWLGSGPLAALAHWGRPSRDGTPPSFWLAASDPWAPEMAWWSAASPSPFRGAGARREAVAAAGAARAVLSPSGSALAVSWKVAGGTTLLVARAGRPILRVGSRELDEAGRLVSLAEAQGELYLLFEREWRLRLAQVRPAGLEWLGRYFTFAADGRVQTQLARSPEGGLALFQRSPVTGWFLHPIALPSGQVGPALHVPPRELSRLRGCAPGRSGFQAVTHLPIVGEADSSSRVGVELPGIGLPQELVAATARVVIDAEGVCVRQFSASAAGIGSARPPAMPCARPPAEAVGLSLHGRQGSAPRRYWCQLPTRE